MNASPSERTFSTADQEAFARWSGDRNPMHMDEAAAARTQAGERVVHGMHAVIWALDRLAADGAPLERLASLKVQFKRFLFLDRAVSLTVTRRDDNGLRAALGSEGATAVTLVLGYSGDPRPDAAAPDGLPETLVADTPQAPSFESMNGMAGRLAPPSGGGDLGEVVPGLCRALGRQRIEGLALLSTLVGMACPGLHSIFSGFTVRMVEPGAGQTGLEWRVEEADDRFRLVSLAVAGSGLAGEVTALARAEPVATPGLAALAAQVRPGEFAGRSALIIGGSKGLGAVTAKLLAAGGARVVLTYAASRDQAEAVAAEIRASSPAGGVSAVSCDVRTGVEALLAVVPPDITHLYYFATPKIFRQRSVTFSTAAFKEFTEIYVDAFSALMDGLAHRCPDSFRNALYPSSSAVAERPAGMTEYAMAKAAGEVLCQDLMQASPGLSILTPRIPRVLTDQTATVPPVEAEDATGVMLPLLRAESAGQAGDANQSRTPACPVR